MRLSSGLALVLIALAAPSLAAPPPGDSARGAALATRWCAGCHLPTGDGAVTDAAPTFHWIAGQAEKDPRFIRAFLMKPHAPMPPLDLSRQDIDDVVAYFKTIAKP